MKTVFKVEKGFSHIVKVEAKIETVYAEKVTEHRVYFGPGSKLNACMVPNYESWSCSYHQYFHTWNAAKQFIIDELSSQIRILKNKIQWTEEELSKAKSMKQLKRIKR
jgi:hypothetical protein